MSRQLPDLSTYGISPARGFLPASPPPTSFADPYYHPWDALVASLPTLIATKKLSPAISSLPILSTAKLTTPPALRRAYVVLAFLVHAHAHAVSPSIPPQLSDPFLAVCTALRMRPVLAYAGLCLWNWAGAPDGPPLASFTGTPGEAAFYRVPVLVEADGGPLVPLLLRTAVAGEPGEVRAALGEAAERIRSMAGRLPGLYADLDPVEFYEDVRPWLGLPEGFAFQQSDGQEVRVDCMGGSAAQSALFQFLDCVLGLLHGGGGELVLGEMRTYMPSEHREFLELVAEDSPTIRSFVEKNTEDAELCQAYESCVRELRLWRGKHIAVVSKYVVQPARLAEKGSGTGTAGEEKGDGLEAGEGAELKGTGGSALIPFLRRARDETVGIDPKSKN